MKKILGIAAVIALIGVTSSTFAQTTVEKSGHSVKKGAKKVGSRIKKGGKAVGNETAETATKVKGKVADKKSDKWVAPNGKDIYVDDGNKYYWINERGGREWVTKDQLKPKQ
ncbi:MAG: hypothetical protein WKF70_15285 [Chitinophagaceae bacterium]